MDDTNVTPAKTPAGEAADRGTTYPLKKLQIVMRIETTQSANHLCGLLHDVLKKRGHLVEMIVVNRSEKPLARYSRPTGR